MSLGKPGHGREPLANTTPDACTATRRQLSDYIEEELASLKRARVENHLRECLECTAMVNGLRNIRQLARQADLIEPPQGFSQRLRWLLTCLEQ